MNKFYLCLTLLPFYLVCSSCNKAPNESSISSEEINAISSTTPIHHELAFEDSLHKEEISFTTPGNVRSMDESSLQQYRTKEDPNALVYYYDDTEKTAFVVDFISKIKDRNTLKNSLRALVQKNDPKVQISEKEDQLSYAYQDKNGFKNACSLLIEGTNSYTVCTISRQKIPQNLAKLVQNPKVRPLQ